MSRSTLAAGELCPPAATTPPGHSTTVPGCRRPWHSNSSSSLLKNPRHSECIVIQFFYHESAGAGMRGAFMDQGGLFSYIAPSLCEVSIIALAHRTAASTPFSIG